jgi:hypothetical protein
MAIPTLTDNTALGADTHTKQHQRIITDDGATAGSLTIQSDDRLDACAGKCGFTPEGGFYITLTNKTGGATTKGYLVRASSTTANAFDYVESEEPDIFGVVYDAGIADGSECRIVVSGIADVYVNADGASLEDFVRMNTTGDTSTADGIAVAEAAPSTPFATNKHFQEVGHAIEARADAGLIKCVLHFN